MKNFGGKVRAVHALHVQGCRVRGKLEIVLIYGKQKKPQLRDF